MTSLTLSALQMHEDPSPRPQAVNHRATVRRRRKYLVRYPSGDTIMKRPHTGSLLLNLRIKQSGLATNKSVSLDIQISRS